MKKQVLYSLVFIFIILFSCDTYAKSNIEQIFYKANRFYNEGNYQDAKKEYMKIYKEDYVSFDLLYNIGNCFVKLEDIGSAVLFYERAKRIKPNNAELMYNMQYLRSYIEDDINWNRGSFISRRISLIFNKISVNRWIWMCTVFWIMFILLIIIGIMNRPLLNKMWYRITAVILVIIILFTLCGFLHWMRIFGSKQAVVLEDKINVRYGPGQGEVIAFVLHEGAIVKIVDKQKGWDRIQLPDGKSGWTKGGNVEII